MKIKTMIKWLLSLFLIGSFFVLNTIKLGSIESHNTQKYKYIIKPLFDDTDNGTAQPTDHNNQTYTYNFHFKNGKNHTWFTKPNNPYDKKEIAIRFGQAINVEVGDYVELKWTNPKKLYGVDLEWNTTSGKGRDQFQEYRIDAIKTNNSLELVEQKLWGLVGKANINVDPISDVIGIRITNTKQSNWNQHAFWPRIIKLIPKLQAPKYNITNLVRTLNRETVATKNLRAYDRGRQTYQSSLAELKQEYQPVTINTLYFQNSSSKANKIGIKDKNQKTLLYETNYPFVFENNGIKIPGFWLSNITPKIFDGSDEYTTNTRTERRQRLGNYLYGYVETVTIDPTLEIKSYLDDRKYKNIKNDMNEYNEKYVVLNPISSYKWPTGESQTVGFRTTIKAYKPLINPNVLSILFENLEALKNQLTQSPNIYYLTTDTGLTEISNEYPSAPNTHSNLYYVNQKADEIIKHYNLNRYPNTKIYYTIENNQISYFAVYRFNDTEYHQLLKNGISVVFEASKFLENSNVKNRLKVMGGYYVNNENQNLRVLQDVGENITHQVKPELENNVNYLGYWKYHTPVKIQFKTTKTENEALFIDNQKIDVIDQNFEFNLNQKWIKEIDQKGEIKTKLKNEYKIEIKQWLNNNNNKGEPQQTYLMHILVESETPKMDLVWYAWDPKNNFNQRLLIEKYLIDINGNFILNDKKEKIPNPKYNPKIDPKTGTIKEIIWVSWSNLSKSKPNYLPTNSKFLLNVDQLDQYYKNNNLKDIKSGFIAEASVIQKGIIFNYQENSFQNGYKTRIPTDGNDMIADHNYAMRNYQTYNFNNNSPFNYFSSSGLWLFYGHTKGGLNSFYRLNYITSKTNNEKSFIEIISKEAPNHKYESFWTTNSGLQLLTYIKNKYNIPRSEAQLLSYEEVVKYYNEWVSKQIIEREINYQKEKVKQALSNNEDSNNTSTTHTPNGTYTNTQAGKINIVIQIDKAKINTIALTYKTYKDITDYLVNNPQAWIKPQSFNNMSLFDIINKPNAVSHTEIGKGNTFYQRRLIFEYSIKDQYKDKFYISNKSQNIVAFSLPIDLIKWNIFDGMPTAELDLDGITTLDQAQPYISKFIDFHINRKYHFEYKFKYGIDYIIINWNDLKPVLKIPNNETVTLKVKAKETSEKVLGEWFFSVVNRRKTELIIPTIKDDKELKLDNNEIVINTDQFDVAKAAIYEGINTALRKYKFVLNNNIFIENEFKNITKSLSNTRTKLPLEIAYNLNIKRSKDLAFYVINRFNKANKFTEKLKIVTNKKDLDLIVELIDKSIIERLKKYDLKTDFKTSNIPALRKLVTNDFINKNVNELSFFYDVKNATFDIKLIYDKNAKIDNIKLQEQDSKTNVILMSTLIPIGLLVAISVGTIFYWVKHRKGRKIK